MNHLMKYLFFIIILPAMTWANAKVIGNGGAGILCGEKNKKNLSVELLDLFEGKELLGLTYSPVSGDYRAKARAIAKAIDTKIFPKGFNPTAQNELEKYIKNVRPIHVRSRLAPTLDIGSIIIPKNCKLVQIVNYQQDGRIYLDKELFELMDNTNKTALLVHEALYAAVRFPLAVGNKIENSEPDSVRVRRAIAHLFTKSGLDPVNLNFPNTENWEMCYTEDNLKHTTWFSRARIGNKTEIRFYFLNAKVPLSQTSIQSINDYAGTEIGYFDGYLNSKIDYDIRIKTSIPIAGTEYLEIFDMRRNEYSKLRFACEKREIP